MALVDGKLTDHTGLLVLKADEVAMDIFARGLLTYTELRVVIYVLCDSWRWRHEKYTRSPVNLSIMARSLGIDRRSVQRAWHTLIVRGVLKVKKAKDGLPRVAFNEHYQTWKTRLECGKLIERGAGKTRRGCVKKTQGVREKPALGAGKTRRGCGKNPQGTGSNNAPASGLQEPKEKQISKKKNEATRARAKPEKFSTPAKWQQLENLFHAIDARSYRDLKFDQPWIDDLKRAADFFESAFGDQDGRATVVGEFWKFRQHWLSVFDQKPRRREARNMPRKAFFNWLRTAVDIRKRDLQRGDADADAEVYDPPVPGRQGGKPELLGDVIPRVVPKLLTEEVNT